jgi:hypothetical protein
MAIECKAHLAIIFGINRRYISGWGVFFFIFFPFGKAGGHQIRCCQGIAVGGYSFTLGALALSPSSLSTWGCTRHSRLTSPGKLP